jgi:hypothetical protein
MFVIYQGMSHVHRQSATDSVHSLFVIAPDNLR